MLEVDDVIARGQRAGDVERGAGVVAPGAAQPALAPEDLVVGEDPQAGIAAVRRDDESAVKHTDRERGRRRRVLALAEQLIEPLALPRVVAEDHRRRRAADQLPEALDVAIDLIGRVEREHDRPLIGRCPVDDAHRPECAKRVDHARREVEQLRAVRRVLPAPSREVDVMRRLLPGPLELGGEIGALGQHEQRVRRKERPDRHALDALLFVTSSGFDGKDQRELRSARRALRVEVEMA